MNKARPLARVMLWRTERLGGFWKRNQKPDSQIGPFWSLPKS